MNPLHAENRVGNIKTCRLTIFNKVNSCRIAARVRASTIKRFIEFLTNVGLGTFIREGQLRASSYLACRVRRLTVCPCLVHNPIVFAYLSVEYAAVIRRANRLHSAYQRLGYRADTLRLYFAGVPGITVTSTAAITALFSVPVVMSFWGAHRITTSAVLAGMAQAGLYVCSGVLVIASLLAVIACAIWIALKFRAQ